MRKYLLFLLVFMLFSFAETSLKKRISDSLYRYEFYTTDRVVSAQPDREYFWFKGGTIHNSEFGTGGDLLHDAYLKFYHSNQLAESGKFKNGLKSGYWKSWYESGVLQCKAYWGEGQLDGSFFTYDNSGKLIQKGKYKNNKKHGVWINYVNKDTLKFNKGEIVIKKVKDTVVSKKDKRPGMLKRLFSKKYRAENDSIKKASQQNVEVQQSIIDTSAVNKNKPNFFKRLFMKKEKKPKNDGQGS